MRVGAKSWLVLLFLGAFPSVTAWAELRTWKASVGNFSTEAEFVELKDGKLVRLRLKDGTQRDIALDKLSAADQDYVAKKTTQPTPVPPSSVPSSTKPTSPNAKSPPASGAPSTSSSSSNRDRLAKLEKDAARCESAEEALRLYRIFRDDPLTTDADRSAIEPKISELRSLAERNMVRLKGQWVTAEVFKQNRDQANSLMKQGLELLRLKQEDSFRKKFAEASALEPDNVRAEFLLALIYGAMAHDHTKAKPYYDACLKRDPENVAVMNNLALTLVRKGDTQNAAMHWRRAAELLPDQRLVQNLGRFLDLAGQKKIAASKATIDIVSNTYATLLATKKFERADLTQGWLYLLIDADSMSIADDENEEKKKASPDNRPPAAEDGSVVVGGGTGWVVFPNYILTNHHVVDGGSSFDIQTSEGGKNSTMRATLVAVQKSPDLAILKCDGLDAPPLTIDPTPLRRGTDIMTLGYPEMFKLGASLKATRGVISAVPASALDDMYLYDAVVNPGNSGGPVFDNRGNVVAVTTVLYMTAGRYGGGIPSSVALDFARKHIPGFSTQRPAQDVLDWPVIDQRVSPSTVLIWTRSKTGGTAQEAPSDDAFEDKSCMVCSGAGGAKCTFKGCKDGVVTINRQKAKCPACKAVGLVLCADCQGTGVELALIPPEKSAEAPSSSPPNNPPPQPNQQGGMQSTPLYRLGPLDANVVAHISAAIKNKQTRETEMVGGGVTPFRNLWAQGSIMVGFDIACAGSGDKLYIAALREVLWSTGGKTISAWHGDPNNRTVLHIGGKPGYAVGAVKARVDSNIRGLTVVFMKINGTRLDPKDSYESDYYGGAGGRETTIASDGALVVGIYGMASTGPNGTVDGLGLITLPKP